MVFDLERSPLFFIIHVGIYIPIFICALVWIAMDNEEIGPTYGLLLIGTFVIVLVILYFVSIRPYYRAKYVIAFETLHCEGGLVRQSIDINSIKTISKSSYFSSGASSALSWYGLKINYSAGYTVFLSPLHQQEFVDTLIKINPNIKYIMA